jgi:hypothetical protein
VSFSRQHTCIRTCLAVFMFPADILASYYHVFKIKLVTRENSWKATFANAADGMLGQMCVCFVNRAFFFPAPADCGQIQAFTASSLVNCKGYGVTVSGRRREGGVHSPRSWCSGCRFRTELELGSAMPAPRSAEKTRVAEQPPKLTLAAAAGGHRHPRPRRRGRGGLLPAH